MQNLFDEVEKELPLLLERETDCRETWPKRWALLKYKVEKLKADNTCRLQRSSDMIKYRKKHVSSVARCRRFLLWL